MSILSAGFTQTFFDSAGGAANFSLRFLAPADNLSARYELSCCNLDEFADVFRINLVRELQQGSIRRRRG